MSRQKMLVLLTILVFIRSLVNCIVCTQNGVCETNFRRHNISLEGCNNTQVSNSGANITQISNTGSNSTQVSNTGSGHKSKLSCANQCTRLNSCTAFTFVGNVCTLCDKESLYDFKQIDERGPFFVKRAATVQDMEVANATFPPNDVVGRMIFFDFTVTGNEKAGCLDIYDSKGNKALIVHCHLNYQGIINGIVLNSHINDTWLDTVGGNNMTVYDPFTMEAGKRSVMYVFITADEFILWIDGNFIHNYAHLVPANDIQWILGKGDVWIHELSL